MALVHRASSSPRGLNLQTFVIIALLGFSMDNDQLPGSEPLENLFELEGDILHPNAETLTADNNDPIYYKYDSDASTPSDLSTYVIYNFLILGYLFYAEN